VTLEVSPHEFPKNEEVILQGLKELQTYIRVETGMLPFEAMERFESDCPIDIDEMS